MPVMAVAGAGQSRPPDAALPTHRRIAIFGKSPPIQGGVSSKTHWFATQLTQRGHSVRLITNADEVEYGYCQLFLPDEPEYSARANRLSQPLAISSTPRISPEDYYHVPFSRAYNSKLFGLGMELVDEFKPDLLFGWYFEPYGMVASILGRLNGIPVVLKHAGSDIGRLMAHPELRKAYRWMLQNVEAVSTTQRDQVTDLLREMGVDEQKMHFSRGSRLPSYFQDSSILPLQDYLEHADGWLEKLGRLPRLKQVVGRLRVINRQDLSEGPIIGMYGKVGSVKGSYDLLDALGRLVRAGSQFMFVTIASGSPPALVRYYEAIVSDEELSRRTYILPPIPPWRIPQFLNMCDVVCFLERDFPIAFHHPVIPREVITRGRCLVVSEEVATKQAFRHNLVDGKNVVIVDPHDTEALARRLGDILSSRSCIENIGGHAKCLGEFLQERLPEITSEVGLVETIEL